MVSTTNDFRALVRGLRAKLLRSNVTTFLLPIGIGFVFTAITAVWTYDSISTLSEQTKRDIHLNLRVAEAKINATLDRTFDGLAAIATSPNPGAMIKHSDTTQVWVFDESHGVLRNSNNPAETISAAKVESHDLAFPSFTNAELVSFSWQRFHERTYRPSDREHIRTLGNLSLFENNFTLGFTLPILSASGKLSGMVITRLPSSSISQSLPNGAYFVDTITSSFLTRASQPLDDFAKERLFRGEVVPNELYSSARRVDVKLSNSDWRIWSDHPISEVWSQPQVRRTLNFPSFLLIGIWGIVIFLVKTSKRNKNRQRQLIGSLVRRIVWITDEDGTIEYVLGRITRQLGWKEVDYSNVSIGLFAHPEDREALIQAIGEAQSNHGQDIELEIRFENKDREFRWYEVTISDMTDVPEINGVVVTAHDIESRKHATDHILASKKAAEKANEAKSEFLSRMSHELRTPLNAILGFGQLLEMEAISDRQSENVGQILIAGRHLLNLVNDILDIARIETRKVNLSVEKVNVRGVIEESFALLGPLAANRGITLALDECECPDVWSDQQRLKQVLLNLISNGIKYNVEGGEVRIHTVVNDDGLRIEVSDTGIGIEAHYLDRVFTPFDRLGSDNSQVEGSGLGLALSKTLVEAMGGTLEVRSEHEVGSTFTIKFQPSSIVAQETASDSNEAIYLDFGDPNDFRILLIEDNVVNLRYVTKVVEKITGVYLMSAKEGGIGIEMARNQHPDLILLDLDLPDLHGVEVLKALKSDPATTNIRVVVMSAETNPHVVEEILLLGADQFVTKPVDVSSLISLFSREKKVA